MTTLEQPDEEVKFCQMCGTRKLFLKRIRRSVYFIRLFLNKYRGCVTTSEVIRAAFKFSEEDFILYLTSIKMTITSSTYWELFTYDYEKFLEEVCFREWLQSTLRKYRHIIHLKSIICLIPINLNYPKNV